AADRGLRPRQGAARRGRVDALPPRPAPRGAPPRGPTPAGVPGTVRRRRRAATARPRGSAHDAARRRPVVRVGRGRDRRRLPVGAHRQAGGGGRRRHGLRPRPRARRGRRRRRHRLRGDPRPRLPDRHRTRPPRRRRLTGHGPGTTGHGRIEGVHAHRPGPSPAVDGGLQRQRLGPPAVRRHAPTGAGQRRRQGRPAGRAHARPPSRDSRLAL
ncbi:MAG: hypothetical protein AVDCRST_MAG52-1226, partial [uncultured Blastococcus sp.]